MCSHSASESDFDFFPSLLCRHLLMPALVCNARRMCTRHILSSLFLFPPIARQRWAFAWRKIFIERRAHFHQRLHALLMLFLLLLAPTTTVIIINMTTTTTTKWRIITQNLEQCIRHKTRHDDDDRCSFLSLDIITDALNFLTLQYSFWSRWAASARFFDTLLISSLLFPFLILIMFCSDRVYALAWLIWTIEGSPRAHICSLTVVSKREKNMKIGSFGNLFSIFFKE